MGQRVITDCLQYKQDDAAFENEKAAYNRLCGTEAQSTGFVLNCFGWTTVTQASFSPCDVPTCAGPEDPDPETNGIPYRSPTLPVKVDPFSGRPIYSWLDPAAKRMRDLAIDFRAPSHYDSWSWNVPMAIRSPPRTRTTTTTTTTTTTPPLRYKRNALLLEYLPGARHLRAGDTPRGHGMQALAGVQVIQAAMISHGDYIRRNLLVTQRARVVWIDFDKATVLGRVEGEELTRFKRELVAVHDLFFK